MKQGGHERKKEIIREPKTSSVDCMEHNNSTIHISALIITHNCIRKYKDQWEDFILSQNTMLEVTQNYTACGPQG